MDICLDSSVIVTALQKQEKDYSIAKNVLRKVKDGHHIAIEPYTVLVEITELTIKETE